MGACDYTTEIIRLLEEGWTLREIVEKRKKSVRTLEDRLRKARYRKNGDKWHKLDEESLNGTFKRRSISSEEIKVIVIMLEADDVSYTVNDQNVFKSVSGHEVQKPKG